MSTLAHHGESPFDQPLSRWQRVDQWIDRGSERLNPILVKEARQALKSRQFLVTFTLLLVCGWGWSLLGVAVLSPTVYYAPSGPFMLIGFYYILTVPLLLIVPFSAYRSLAAEREDGTYELLSISTLTARQIVTGKLCSAMLQMLVYYSALSPCIAFTYLLRGVDIFTIMLVLFYTFLASVLLSAVGLLVATITTARHIQVLLSVVLLLGLVAATITWCTWIAIVVYESASIPYDDADLWVAQAAILSGYATYFILLVLAASAQLSFASDNRSTKLRIVMLVQHSVLIGWMSYWWMLDRQEELLYTLVSFCGLHWMVMGAMMIGEQAQLSPRVRRQLPVTLAGRALLTWFNPGSGTGYVFAVINYFSAVVLVMIATIFAQIVGFNGTPDLFRFGTFCTLLGCYLIVYLGVTRILTIFLREYLYFGLLLPFLLTAILIVMGVTIPLFFQMWIGGFNQLTYTSVQASNWAWTLVEAADGDLFAQSPITPIIILLVACILFPINLALAAREIDETRSQTPHRILLDQLELNPSLTAAPPKPRSPWDDD
jgi:ABC-type transport system involved in cytochrome c biogenesis permease component